VPLIARTAGTRGSWAWWSYGGGVSTAGARSEIPARCWEDAIIEARGEVCAVGVDGWVDLFEERDADGVVDGDLAAIVARLEIGGKDLLALRVSWGGIRMGDRTYHDLVVFPALLGCAVRGSTRRGDR
jgi:hypothetical protein